MTTLYASPTGVGDPTYTEWNSSGNILASDDVYADTDTSGKRIDTDGYNLYPLVIPSGGFMVIEDMLFRIEAKTAGIGLARATLGVAISWDGGTSWTNTYTRGWALADGEVVKDIAAPASSDGLSWGRMWKPEELSSSNFRARITLTKIDASTTVYIDHVEAGVNYKFQSIAGTFGHIVGDDQDLVSAF